MGKLEGKVAIVTGGTRGIGFGIVEKFLAEGAKVALFGSRQETVDAALEKIKQNDPEAPVMGLHPALTDPDEIAAAFK
ncbi:MAG: SDR family NAD(P)-dependent oxidoreductase, partial [Eggerthellaceae bacterium]